MKKPLYVVGWWSEYAKEWVVGDVDWCIGIGGGPKMFCFPIDEKEMLMKIKVYKGTTVKLFKLVEVKGEIKK